MGRQQKMKRERQAGKTPNKHAPRPVRKQTWMAWLIGVVVVFGLLLASLFFYVRANQERFMKITIVTSAQKVQTDLSRTRAAFTLAENARLRGLLTEIERLGAKQDLDRQVGGHLMFILQVAKEIVASGKLQPGELDKMDTLLREAQRRLGPPAPPSDATNP